MKFQMIKKMMTVCLLATTTMVSCKKDNEIIPQQPAPVVKTIEGRWTGEYGAGNAEPSTFFAFNARPDGVLEIVDENNKVTGTGTWKLEENIFTGSYKYTNDLIGFSLAAKYDADADKLTGSWGVGNDTGSGDFYMNKQ